MDNFSLILTNGSTVYDESAVLCYKDSKPGIPHITQERACNIPAKQFFFFNRRENTMAFVELCYIEIHGKMLSSLSMNMYFVTAFSLSLILDIFNNCLHLQFATRTTGCWSGTWGTNCAKLCPTKCTNQHCFPRNGSCVWGCDPLYCQAGRCNAETSACTRGCVKGRAGKYCTHHNVVYYGTAKQHPSHPTAKFSIDGELTSCTTITGTQQRPYLQIDTGSLSVITAVHLTFGDKTFLGNHTLYCSNTTDSWVDGTQLYHGKILDNDIGVFGFCKYVVYCPSILNDYSKVDLCEIEIGGCPSRKYGVSCEMHCPKNCHGPCDLTTGDCLFGCLDGWLDKKCDKVCKDGSFGGQCLRNCSINCVLPPCNHVTGECERGCIKGWEGFNCTKGVLNCKQQFICEDCKRYC
ncbi:unnamed protein product [Mytilus coruscus]|uniref:MEGF10_11 n=1 Tax=Mytilus coruscus TaxID=42192 RepID=A0A6J8DG54_MYTCO|nr:unnamed protein product [Mytilus coruscus]